MVMVRSGNDAFRSLVRRVRRNNEATAISLEEIDGEFHVSVVTLCEAWPGVSKVDRKGVCKKGEVADFINSFGLGVNPLCLMPFKQASGQFTCGWAVVNPSTMERCGEVELYNHVS